MPGEQQGQQQDPLALAPGERLVRVGGLIAAVGAVATLVALVPLFNTSFEPPPWLWFVAIGGVGIGVAMSLWGMVRAARARSRFVREIG